MGRPPDINQLISNTDKLANDFQLLEKPRFLSKLQRQQLSSKSQNQKKNVAPNMVKTARGIEFMEDEGENQSFSQRLADEVSKEEDTLANYEAITSIRVKDLMSRPKDNIEQFYMGKHWAEKSLQEMTERDWRIFKEDLGITMRGGHEEYPLRSWYELTNGKIAHSLINKMKFDQPTPIQRAVIPNVCKNFRDLLGIASTGSGKTLAFIIPMLIRLDQIPSRPLVIKKLDGPLALILVPTRELAQQIEREAQELIATCGAKGYEVISIVGGHSLEEISLQLSLGSDLLVATPGRLIDCLENHLLTLSKVETLVLDEADRMIDMGFEEQVTSIICQLTHKRQTMMFTASMTLGTEKIAAGYLKNPVRITISGSGQSAPMIRQIVELITSEELRFKRTVELLSQYEAPIIIFINYKRTADWLVQKFSQETAYKVTVLHGSKSQEQREHSLQLLRKSKVQILIATNVAARGLDVPDVSLVINFQVSQIFEDYVHRIGRTGRAGNKGTSITFLGDNEEPEIIRQLYKYLQENNPTGENHFPVRLKEKYRLGKRRFEEVLY